MLPRDVELAPNNGRLSEQHKPRREAARPMTKTQTHKHTNTHARTHHTHTHTHTRHKAHQATVCGNSSHRTAPNRGAQASLLVFHRGAVNFPLKFPQCSFRPLRFGACCATHQSMSPMRTSGPRVMIIFGRAVAWSLDRPIARSLERTRDRPLARLVARLGRIPRGLSTLIFKPAQELYLCTEFRIDGVSDF